MGKRKNSAGFSLVELLIAVLLASVIAAGVYMMMRSQARTSKTQIESSQTLRDSQRARLVMETDISRAGFDPRAYDPTPVCGARYTPVPAPTPPVPPCYFLPITTAANDHLVLQGDFNMDGTVSNTGAAEPEVIDYQYEADKKQVTRGDGANQSPFLRDVGSFNITYYNKAEPPTPTPLPNPVTDATRSTIRKVKVEWTQVRSDWTKEPGNTQREERHELWVTLRNAH